MIYRRGTEYAERRIRNKICDLCASVVNEEFEHCRYGLD
jgi:hypothetical protein